MRRLTLLLILLCTLVVLVWGCSGGENPAAPNPAGGKDLNSATGGRCSLGAWEIAVDLDNATIEAVQKREADKILNVLGFMEPPALEKLAIDFDTLVINGENSTVGVDVVFTHPLVTPDNAFQGFDVRGIVFGPTLLNPDGYTPVMNPADFTGVPFGYQDGLLGAPNSYAGYDAPIWPYKYFCDDLDATTELSEFFIAMTDEEIAAHRGKYSEGQVHTRHYDLSWAGLESPIDFLVFNYAVYANFDWGVGDPPFDTEDFPITTANSAEAFCMSYSVTENTLNYYEGVGQGELSLLISVWDWQGLNSTMVEAESIEPGLLTPVSNDTFGPGSDPFEGQVALDDIPGVPVSTTDIDILVKVTDNSETYGSAWFFGMLPETHDFYDLPVANFWIISVPVSGEPACPTVEPVNIEAPPYNGTWFDDLTEDTACACEVSTGTTDLYWTHDPAATTWNSGNSGGVYDDNMNTYLVGPQIMAPSTNAIKFTFHFDSVIGTGEAVTIGYKMDDSAATMVLTQSAAVSDYNMEMALGGIPDDSVISWVIEFASDAADNVGTGCTLWDVTSVAYDPGPLPDINDGGTPNPANEICSTGAAISFYSYWSSSNDYYYIYYYWIGTSMPINWSWGGAVPVWFCMGDSGFIFPGFGASPTVTMYGHRECVPGATDQFFAYGDYQATCQYASSAYNHGDLAADCAGEVRHQVLDAGTSTERWVIQWCNVGQIDEADTTNWRVIFNGVNNANPNDMRIEIIDAGSRVNETSSDYTGGYMVYNGVYIPVQCDYTAWTDNMAIDIDQP